MPITITTLAGTAGRALGTAARGLLWAHRTIDWAEVAAIVLHGLQLLIAVTLLAGRTTRRAWDALVPLSERLGQAYSSWLVGTPAVAPVPPVVHPLQALATELEQLTRAELQALVGTRRKLGKAQLVAMALAC